MIIEDSILSTSASLFNFTVPWLSVLLIIILALVSVILYYVPLRYLILAFVINKFTKRFRKPKGYVDNNEVADFISRLPSDPELVSSSHPASFLSISLRVDAISGIEAPLSCTDAEEGQTIDDQQQMTFSHSTKSCT